MTGEQPIGLRPVQDRGITIHVEARSLDHSRKEGRVGGFSIQCDEGPNLGGQGTAPSPLMYLASSLAF